MRGVLSLPHVLAHRRRLIVAAAALAGVMAAAQGGEGLEQMLQQGRDRIRAQPASGDIHIVEIDGRSLQALDRWPVPRRYHAQLIDRLRHAGVRSIAFDVDFSALSNPADDRALAHALRRAGGSVILPAFRQQAHGESSQIVENTPAKPFRENAFVAAVNVHPDADGFVRRMPLGHEIGGVARPSLASMVAEVPAEAGTAFAIDYAIVPASVPRHSMVDVLDGRVPAAVLRDQRVIIGGTAIEMGDRYVVPGHGVIPGVVIQALAAETLLRGPIPGHGGAVWPLLLALAMALAAMRRGYRGKRAALLLGGAVAVLALSLAAQEWWALTFDIVPALAALAVAGLGTIAAGWAMRYRARRLTDAATGLPNRVALAEDLHEAPASAVVVAAIDRFPALASALGPEVALRIVQRVAERLHHVSGGDIYRIDEATLAWAEQRSADAIETCLEEVTAAMRLPVDCGRPVAVALHCGVAAAGQGDTAAALLANAELAAARACARGVPVLRFAVADADEAGRQVTVLSEIDAALAAGQIWNAYQPQLDLATGRIRGVEALVRWSHPERGNIPPDAFIPLVEAQGRIDTLTLHVLDEALTDAALWRGAGYNLHVAVNMSAALLGDHAFIAQVRERIERSPVPAAALTIEVTESAAMADAGAAVLALEDWRTLGVGVSIDDYGTGQSSLGYLQTLPATELKIDRSFVAEVATDGRSAIMVRSTVTLAHELGLTVVAEGVENAACMAELARMGCDLAQGWHIGRPMRSADLLTLLTEEAKAAA